MKALSHAWGRVGRYALMAVLLLLLAFSVLLWYVTTPGFEQLVRGRLVRSIERASGGRVELGSFTVRPLRLEIELGDLTIYGKETAEQKPYLHIESMTAVVKLSSALGWKLAFHSLTLRRPVIHIIFYPDGTTNQPATGDTALAGAERFLSFSIDRLRLEGGELIWQDQQVPLDFRSEDVSARLNYSLLHGRYWGELDVGRAESHWDGYRPLAWAGRAVFAFDRKRVEIQSLVATAGHSQVRIRGLLLNPTSPSLKASYDLALNLRDLAAVSRAKELKSGTLEIKGDGSWSAQDFLLVGGFRVRELAWHNDRFSIPDLAAEGKFLLDPRQLSLTNVEGQLLKGSFSAQADVDNWRQTNGHASRTVESGIVRIKTRDLSLAEILGNLGPEFHPLNQLRFSGSLSASSELRWKDSPRYGRLATDAEIAPPAHPSRAFEPVAATAQLSYDGRSGALEIGALSLRTPSSEVRASGGVSPAGSLKLSLATSNMGEWQPIESLLFPEGAPFVVHGRASFDGGATGALPEIRIRGRIVAEDFDFFLPTVERAKRWHWDALRADIDASRTGLALHNAVLDRGNARVALNGSTQLVAWRELPASPFNFQVNVQNADAHELGRLAGYNRELSGTLSAAFNVSGSSLRPEARGSFRLIRGTVEGVAFDTAIARFALNKTQASFTDFSLRHRQAEIHGGAAFDLSSQAFRFDLEGADFDLAEIAPLEHSRVRLGGKLDFSAHGSGSTSNPELAADLNLRGLSFNEETEGDLKLTAVAHGADLHLTGRSAFKTAELAIGGQVRLRAAWPAHIDFHFERLDVDPLVQSYLKAHLAGHSAVSGDLALDGPLRNPERLTLTGTLTQLEAQVEKIQLHNQGPIRFAIADQLLRLDDLHVLGPNTDFSAHGRVELRGERRIDLEGRGKVDLKLVESYNPDFTSSGEIAGQARITGSLQKPEVNGSFDIQNGAIANINVPSALSDINGRLQFTENRLTIESLRARTGGGSLTFTGYAELKGGQLNFDVAANADSVRLRYPPGVSSTADARLRWSGSSSSSVISGDITITKVGFTPGFDFGAYLERSAQVAGLPQTSPVLNRIHLDLHLVTAPELQMQTSVIRLQGEADLRVRGSAAKPVLLGRADIFEGEAYFEGTKYRLERGGVTFTNPVATSPFLDVEATTHIRDYDITLSLSGEIGNGKQPRLNYRSEPPLPPADIISLLAFGQTSEQSAQLQEQSQSAFSQQASSAMLAAALNATLNNRAQRLFGNSRIKIDPLGLETYTSSTTQYGPAVTIEQQVQDNLTVSYTTSVAQTSQQVIRAEYNVTHNLSIVAIRDQNGVVSFDVKIRRRQR